MTCNNGRFVILLDYNVGYTCSKFSTKNNVYLYFFLCFSPCGYIIIYIIIILCATVTPSFSTLSLPFFIPCTGYLFYFRKLYKNMHIDSSFQKTIAHNFPIFLFLFRTPFFCCFLLQPWLLLLHDPEIFPLILSLFSHSNLFLGENITAYILFSCMMETL